MTDPYTIQMLSYYSLGGSLFCLFCLAFVRLPNKKQYSNFCITFGVLAFLGIWAARILEIPFFYYASTDARKDKIQYTRSNNVNVRDTKGNSLVMNAAKYGSLNVLRYLINHKANVHFVDNNGDTALMIAERYHHTECANILRVAGAVK